MSTAKRYPFYKVHVPPGILPPVMVDILETSPHLVKSVSKRYPDGRTLHLHLVDEVIIEKHLTFPWPCWDYEMLNVEKEKGAKVSFKYYAKNGYEVGLTYYGSILISQVVTLTAECKKKVPHLFPADWHDELTSEIGFPSVSLDKIHLNDGYSKDEFENLRMKRYFEEDILDALARNDENNREIVEVAGVEIAPETADTACELCGETPCVWLREQNTVIAMDDNAHAGSNTPNNTRRRLAFKHMYRVRKGIGKTGVRERHPQCVEEGIRALFPSSKHMGYREA
jgi:hypothetical protein